MLCHVMSGYVMICYAMSCQFEPAHFLLEWNIFAENSMSEETKKLVHPLGLKKKEDIFTKVYNFVSIKAKLIIFTSAFITTCLGSAAVREQEAWKRTKYLRFPWLQKQKHRNYCRCFRCWEKKGNRMEIFPFELSKVHVLCSICHTLVQSPWFDREVESNDGWPIGLGSTMSFG